jgi:hypothetical protein
MTEKDPIREVSGACAGCKSGYSGRVTDRAMESWGWRKINGEWYCNLCSGAGYAGIKRRDDAEDGL